MGFDVSGLKPETEEGVYFRNNVWWWRPLWSYVCETCGDIVTLEQAKSGTYNDGVKITAEQSLKIFKRLMELKEKGITTKHQVKHEARRIQSEKDNKGLKCGDKGYTWDSSYPFAEDNVDDFAEFCKYSGGFEIW